ncbi:MAG: zf-HC2 domain-containing protein [Elusimicrobia bacterium]|nr:zf-HC2 domain-containing protein [Elusimicrobiota bacterium]
MKHENFRELIDEMRDGDLPDQLKKEFAAHLSACDACRRDYERRLSLVRRLFRPAEAPSAAQVEAFTRAVMEKIPGQADAAAPRMGAWRNLWWIVPSLGFALAALILALRRGAPALMVPLDSQLLIGSHSTVAEMVAPLDPANSRRLVAVEEQ